MCEFHATIIIFLWSHFVTKIINYTLSRRHKPIPTCPKLIHNEGSSILGEKVCVYFEIPTSAVQQKSTVNCHAGSFI